jgi:diadenylate cyclase
VLQPAELVCRISEEIETELVELGEEGRLLRLQLDELVEGVEDVRRLVVRDYVHAELGVGDAGPDDVLAALGTLSTQELLDDRRMAATLGMAHANVEPDHSLEPRGYRLLHRLPRFPEAIIERIVEHFQGLQRIMRASVGELEEVDGVGESRARSVKDGLARLAEASILDRYS